MIRYIKGDITKSNCDIICHQVNCQDEDDLTWKERFIVEEYNRKVPIDSE